MDASWFEESSPSLTRASSMSEERDDEELQERQLEALVQATSQLAVSIGAEDSLDKTCNTNVISEYTHIFFDESESYENNTESQVIFGELENELVSSPEAADFHWLDDSLPPGDASVEPHATSDLSTRELVASPMSATFSFESNSPRIDSLSNEHEVLRTGRRKALLIGIRYCRNESLRSLEGPHHDVLEVQRLLRDVYGWGSECFRVLKDDNRLARNQPTLENIRHEIKQLVEDAQPGDHLFFYFSGHGGQVPDTDGDEEDGWDEVIVACDGQKLVDDELHDILVKPLPTGCHLTAVLDCCHSGTSFDLPYDAVQPSCANQRNGPMSRKHSNGNVVLLSACADAEQAFEKQDQEDKYNRVRGMLTKAFIDSLKTRRKSTYDELLTSVRSQMKRRDTMQNPQLSSSRVIDMNDYFDL